MTRDYIAGTLQHCVTILDAKKYLLHHYAPSRAATKHCLLTGTTELLSFSHQHLLGLGGAALMVCFLCITNKDQDFVFYFIISPHIFTIFTLQTFFDSKCKHSQYLVHFVKFNLQLQCQYSFREIHLKKNTWHDLLQTPFTQNVCVVRALFNRPFSHQLFWQEVIR